MLADMVNHLRLAHKLSQSAGVDEGITDELASLAVLGREAGDALKDWLMVCPRPEEPHKLADFSDGWWQSLWEALFPYWVNLRYELFAEHWDLEALVTGGFVHSTILKGAQSSASARENLGNQTLALARLPVVDALDSLSELGDYQPLPVPDYGTLLSELSESCDAGPVAAPELVQPWQLVVRKDLDSWLAQVLAEGLSMKAVCPLSQSSPLKATTGFTLPADQAFPLTADGVVEGTAVMARAGNVDRSGSSDEPTDGQTLADSLDAQTAVMLKNATAFLDEHEDNDLDRDDEDDFDADPGAQTRWEHQQELFLGLTLEPPAVLRDILDRSVFEPWQWMMIDEALAWLEAYDAVPNGEGGCVMPGWSPIWQGQAHNLAQGIHAQLAGLAVASNPQFHPLDPKDQMERCDWLSDALGKTDKEIPEPPLLRLFAIMGRPLHRLALMASAGSRSVAGKGQSSSSALH